MKPQVIFAPDHSEAEAIARFHDDLADSMARSLKPKADTAAEVMKHRKYARSVRDMARTAEDGSYSWNRFASPIINFFSGKSWVRASEDNLREDEGPADLQQPNGAASNIVRSVNSMEQEMEWQYTLLKQVLPLLPDAGLTSLNAHVKGAIDKYEELHHTPIEARRFHNSRMIHEVRITSMNCPACKRPATRGETIISQGTIPIHIYEPCMCKVRYVIDSLAIPEEEHGERQRA